MFLMSIFIEWLVSPCESVIFNVPISFSPWSVLTGNLPDNVMSELAVAAKDKLFCCKLIS